MGEFIEKYKEFLLFMFVYWGICFVMLFKDNNFLYAMLSWNLLLAILPLLFITKAKMTIENSKAGWTVFWTILWLLFFPNSVYMVTDFIHISKDKFMWLIDVERYSPDSGVVYSNEIMVWTKLLVIGMGFFFALLAGLESLYIFEQNIRRKYSTVIYSLVLLVVALLTGIGVYIGRFLRFNSWDVIANPMQLLKQVIILEAFAVQFIIVFTCFVLGSYILYRSLRKQSLFEIEV